MRNTSLTVEEVQELVGRQIGRRGVRAEDHLVADLGIESIDVLNLVNTVEAKYEISLQDDEIGGLATVGDLHALVARKVAP
jgi:acyl carrier protein